MYEARIRFVVDGEPRSQGSMTAVYNRKLGVSRVRHSNAPALSLWRGLCREAAMKSGAEIWEGPVGMTISFGISAPINQKHGYPKRPDLDKLVRGVLDALTGVCYRDDSQVVTLQAQKVWEPVTIIEVWRIERQSTKSTSAQGVLWTDKDNADWMEAHKAKGTGKG